MNSVVLTSVLSAGNHALFAGTRVLYGLSLTSPSPQAPRIFSWTTVDGVPLPALLATSSVSVVCFLSSYVGDGELWGWLQNIVGVSNQVCCYFFRGLSALLFIDRLAIDRSRELEI
jgi:amino acid transporter, AAT family